jgi:hypothetical protein
VTLFLPWSLQELESFEAKPSKPLDGYDAEIYKVYKYAAFKVPATEDPRASLRGLFASKVPLLLLIIHG